MSLDNETDCKHNTVMVVLLLWKGIYDVRQTRSRWHGATSRGHKEAVGDNFVMQQLETREIALPHANNVARKTFRTAKIQH